MKRIELHYEGSGGRRIRSVGDTVVPASRLVVRLEEGPQGARYRAEISGRGHTSHPDVKIRIHLDSGAEVADRQRYRFDYGGSDADGAARAGTTEVRSVDQRSYVRHRPRLVRVELSDEGVAGWRTV